METIMKNKGITASVFSGYKNRAFKKTGLRLDVLSLRLMAFRSSFIEFSRHYSRQCQGEGIC
jgi:hypothetical protein